MTKTYIFPDGKKAVFEYDHNGVGKITLESMDMLMGELIAYKRCVQSRSFWDSKHCDGCRFYDNCPFNPREIEDESTAEDSSEVEWVYNKRERLWYPYSNGELLFKDKPTTQTETQNSNLTFKTLEYCDICDHKGCEECISNALDEYCVPSHYHKVEDEPQTDCFLCKWLGEVDVCGRCRNRNLFAEAEPQPRCPKCGKRGYIRSLESMGVKLKVFDEYKWKCTNCNKYFKEEPKDEPQTENLFTDKDGGVWEWRGDAWYCISGDEPQTDCAWK